jgi:cyclase
MYRNRVIPCLLLDGHKLIKTIGFDAPSYVGDPINAVKIFNEKEIDELIILDIYASKRKCGPDFDYIQQLASECFMPLCYGGGVSSMSEAEVLFASGIEKIALNQVALQNPNLITDLAQRYGSQSVVGVIDVKKTWLAGYRVWNHVTHKAERRNPVEWARELTESGAGELLINNVDRDGTLKGFDIGLVQAISRNVAVPVIACGGASNLENCREVVLSGGASAAAAGSLFVYKGPHRAVLINYPDPIILKDLFKEF